MTPVLMRTSRMRIFLHWIPALAGIGVIVTESTALFGASNTSRWLYPLWVHLFGPIQMQRWLEIHHYIRKAGHFGGYGMISLTFYHGWSFTLGARARDWFARGWLARFRQSALLALLCTLLLASWDEWHQSFIPGRTSTLRDVALDVCGALIAHLILLGFLAFFRRRPGGMLMQTA